LKNSSTIGKKFLSTASLQIVSRGLSVLAGLILARYLGPEEYGLYTYILSIIAIVTIPVIAGLPQLLIREVAHIEVEENWADLKGLFRWSSGFVVLISSLMMLAVLLALLFELVTETTAHLLWFAMLLIPIKSFSSKQGAILNGLSKPILGLLPEFILMPFMAIFIYTFFILFNTAFTALLLIKVQIFTSVLTMLLGLYLIHKNTPREIFKVEPNYSFKKWNRALLPFSLMFFISTMNSELANVVLGYFKEKETVGFFKVALQGITLVTLGMTAVNSILGPKIAKSYRKNNIAEAQELLKKSVRLNVCFSIPIALLLIVFGEWLITIFFGESFKPAYQILCILCVGQIINIFLGSVGLVLNMTGNERNSLKSLFITLVINMILLFTLVPIYGSVGAALSVSISLVIWNLLMSFEVHKLTKLKTWLT
tara:strand:- start:5979 stop:7256 length:1278 start_codon:yes stop_codon:yes gene_type:complete